MSARKKIHTTATERLSTRNNKKPSQTRREIAAEAARIMVTQTQFNFRIAKQKAAERLGISTRVALPSHVDLRQAPLSPVDGRPQKRAPLSEVECLLTSG
ncbi:MAG: hypothetical protein BMS9Abin30_0418 [Gammaproteobacteria bacterium]|nr:MAG: hypothetical protein BMS9Abin30_0418 [Gammaproteobacteria bacterium]